jgi:hypothetical protein
MLSFFKNTRKVSIIHVEGYGQHLQMQLNLHNLNAYSKGQIEEIREGNASARLRAGEVQPSGLQEFILTVQMQDEQAIHHEETECLYLDTDTGEFWLQTSEKLGRYHPEAPWHHTGITPPARAIHITLDG